MPIKIVIFLVIVLKTRPPPHRAGSEGLLLQLDLLCVLEKWQSSGISPFYSTPASFLVSGASDVENTLSGTLAVPVKVSQGLYRVGGSCAYLDPGYSGFQGSLCVEQGARFVV